MTAVLAAAPVTGVNPFAWLALLIGPVGFGLLGWWYRRYTLSASRPSLRRRFRMAEEDELVAAHRRSVRDALQHPHE